MRWHVHRKPETLQASVQLVLPVQANWEGGFLAIGRTTHDLVWSARPSPACLQASSQLWDHTDPCAEWDLEGYGWAEGGDPAAPGPVSRLRYGVPWHPPEMAGKRHECAWDSTCLAEFLSSQPMAMSQHSWDNIWDVLCPVWLSSRVSTWPTAILHVHQTTWAASSAVMA